MIEIKVISDLEEAKRLWNELSPKESIYDLWDFRYCFYKYNPWPLCFYAAFADEQAVALLPLQNNNSWGGLEFFTEDPCEENRPFIRPGYEKIIPDLYQAIIGPAKCHDISGDDDFTVKLPLEDYKYVLPLTGFKNFADFLRTRLSGKRQRSLIKELADLEKNKIEVTISNAARRPDDLELLFTLNTANFAGESYLKEVERAPWRDLLKLPFDWRLATVAVNGAKQAVSLSVLYNNYWYYLITGVNFQNFQGLGKYLAKINIEAALAAGVDIFDAGLGSCGWKDLWHFDKIPQYEFTKLA